MGFVWGRAGRALMQFMHFPAIFAMLAVLATSVTPCYPCLCRSGHLPVHPFASSQPYWAQEHIKTARTNLNLWGLGGITEGSAPATVARPMPQRRGPLRGVPAGRGAGGGGRRPQKGGAPTGAAHSSGPLGPAPLDDGGATAPPLPRRVPGYDPGVGHRPEHAGEAPGKVETALPRGGSTVCGLGGLHVHEAHLAAAAAFTAHGNVQWVMAVVHVQGGSKLAPTVAALLQALRRSKTTLAVPGTALQGVVRTEHQPWETADPEVVDPAPPGHILQLVWERLPEDDNRETAELPDIDPAPLDALPSTVDVVCVPDPAVLADADIRSTWGPSARTTPGGTSSRSWGQPWPTPRPCRLRLGGQRSRSRRISLCR